MNEQLSASRRPRALLVTDQLALRRAMRLALNHGSFDLEDAVDLSEARGLVQTWQPHIVILDMDIEGGREALGSLGSNLTSAGSLPIIALSRGSNLRTKLDAFELGAEDILTLPFAPEELLARSVAVTRRVHKAPVELLPVMTVGDLEFDIMTRGIRVGGHEVRLTALEMALLYLFAANPGEPLSRDTIANYLWGPDYDLGSNVVDVHIRHLRVQLNNSWKKPRYIFTVPGCGYQFLPPGAVSEFHPALPIS